MRLLFPTLLFTAFFFIISCGNKNDKQTERTDSSLIKDSLSTGQAPADTTLAAIMPVIEKELNAWVKSFKGFVADSFKYTQTTKFEEIAYQETTGMDKFYELYKPSLVFSGDSNQFIDIYSAGIMLEKKVRKLLPAQMWTRPLPFATCKPVNGNALHSSGLRQVLKKPYGCPQQNLSWQA